MNNPVFQRVVRFAAIALFPLTASNAEAATTVVRAGSNLQTALNAAQPGDTLLLDAGATFTGNFVLPVKGGSAYITVRTAPVTGQPAEGTRVTPANAPLLARIQSGNTMPALTTAQGAHHWRLQLLEFGPNRDGYGEIIQLGDGSSAQYALSQVPFEIELERLYIHGDKVMGQKRGIALNARTVTIRDCYISDIRAVGMDTQAIGGWNGPGGFVIENNYLEAAGENVMFGGADPAIPYLVTTDISIRHNLLSRPMSWRNPVVATPTGLSATPQGTGALAGIQNYRVVAQTRVSGGVVARSAASVEVSADAGSSTSIVVAWTPVANATEYYVYRRSAAGSQNFKVTGATFTDTGAAGQAGAAPTTAGHTWTVKNLLELKNARTVVIEDNVLENHWAGAQAGYAIVMTPRNQDGRCSWCTVEDVTFQHNVLRNAAGGINILGHDNLAPSQQARRIRIAQNLFYGISTTLGGAGWFMMIGNGPADIVVDHNTVDADGTTAAYLYSGLEGTQIPGAQFTNNAARHATYGINGADATYGNGVIALYFPNGIVVGNWLQGGYAPRYPAGNFFNGTTFAAAFVDVAGADYTAAPGGPLKGRATDGTDVGVDASRIAALTAEVVGGTMKPRPSPPPNFRTIR